MPIVDFLGDDEGDLAVVNGDFAFAGGDTDEENRQAVGQLCDDALGMLKGESFLDESIGVDYLGKILVKNPQPAVVEAELTRNLVGIQGVSSVQSAGLVGPEADRTASIDYAVQTPYGSQTGSVQPPGASS